LTTTRLQEKRCAFHQRKKHSKKGTGAQEVKLRDWSLGTEALGLKLRDWSS